MKSDKFISFCMQFVRIFAFVLVLSGCNLMSDAVDDSKPDARLGIGEIFRVTIQYGDALNVDNGGSYSVEIKNPKNNYRDIVIWETTHNHKNVEEKNRNYSFKFYDDNFWEGNGHYTDYPDKYKNNDEYTRDVVQGDYDVIIRNSFGYEKKYKVEVQINFDDLYSIIFIPGVIEKSVP